MYPVLELWEKSKGCEETYVEVGEMLDVYPRPLEVLYCDGYNVAVLFVVE